MDAFREYVIDGRVTCSFLHISVPFSCIFFSFFLHLLLRIKVFTSEYAAFFNDFAHVAEAPHTDSLRRRAVQWLAEFGA